MCPSKIFFLLGHDVEDRKKCELIHEKPSGILVAKVIPNRVPGGLARGHSFGHPQIRNVGVGVGFWRQKTCVFGLWCAR